MTALLLLVLAQAEPDRRPFRAVVRIEESARGSDAVDRASGTLVVNPGGALAVAVDGRRPPPGHPLELWALEPSEWCARYDVSREAASAERALPGGVVDSEGRELSPIRVGRSRVSMAVATTVEEPTDERFRLVPREPGPYRALIAWVEKESGRLVRVEAEGARHMICALESIRVLDSPGDR